MTTQVNVTSTTGGQQLVDRAKTQQGASRFAFQEKQASVADAKRCNARTPLELAPAAAKMLMRMAKVSSL